MVLRKLSEELDQQTSAEPYDCIRTAIYSTEKLPETAARNLMLLGKTLGRFDLQGQLSGIEAVMQLCQRDLKGLQCDMQTRLRSYRTLGICTGAALVILFI